MRSSQLFATLSVVLLAVGFVLDEITSPHLVGGILLSVPVALSAFVMSRTFTVRLIVAALVANVLAGLEYPLQPDEWSGDSLYNRAFSMLSVGLVGVLALRLREVAAQAERLSVRERRAVEDRRVRDLTMTVDAGQAPEAFVSQVSLELRELLGARAVTVAAVHDGRLGSPYASTAPGPYQPGSLSPDEAPVGSQGPADPRERVVVRRWHRRQGPPLVVIAVAPGEGEALLGKAIEALEPLLDQAALLDDLRQQRAALERRNAVIRDLVYAFSHDLRTPLLANAMSMRLALSGVYGDLPDEYRRSLAHGLDSNQDLLDLADKLLLLAKLESGELTEGHTDLDLQELVLQRANELRPTFEARDVELRLDLSAGLAVRGSASELRRVVQNLLDNALRHAPPHSAVTVRLERQGAQALLTVADLGPGVPAHLEGRLFQRFRGHGAGAGSGLGLYLARSIVEAHGGRLEYRREDGSLTVFQVRLPPSIGARPGPYAGRHD